MKIFVIVLLLIFKEGYGAADFEVERVQSPYVEKRDVGPLMQSESTSQHMSVQSASPFRSYSTFDRPSRGCLSCQHGIGGHSSNSGGGSSSSYSSFSSYGGGMSPVYSSPRQSSSRHEFRKEQEFVNGQQVYDFHHEKKYQDGQLIDESRHEKVPEDFGVGSQLSRGKSSSLYSPPASTYGSSSSFSESQRGSSYHTAPKTSYQTRHYHGSQNSGIGSDHDFDDDHFDDEFEREMERLQEELRRKTLTSVHHPVISSPTYGGSHKSEFRKETRYVNGKPVYMINEEKKYKDGQLIHNVRDEKGPEDLGTTDVLSSSPVLTSPTGKAFSSHHHEVYESKSQIPVSGPSYHPSYPSSPRNTNERIYNPSYSSSSELTANIYKQQPHYRPSSVYTSQTVEEQKETQTRRNYYPTYDRSIENEIESYDKTYSQSNRRGPHVDSYYRPETTTPSTSTIAGPLYDSRPNYNQQSPSEHRSYEEQSSSTQYSHNRPANTPVTYKNDNNYEQTYGNEDKIKVASQSSYYDLKSRQTSGEDRDRSRHQHSLDRTEVVDQDEDESPSYNTGVFSTHSQSQETKTSHTSPSRTNIVSDSSRSYRPGVHTTSSSQEEYSRRISSHHYPSGDQRPEVPSQQYPSRDERPEVSSQQYPSRDQRPEVSSQHYSSRDQRPEVSSQHYPSRDQRPEISSSPNVNVPGVIRGPSDHYARSEENEIEEEERYDVSPYDGISDTEPDDENSPRNVQYERNPTSPHEYGSRRYPEPDRYSGQNQRGYSIYNTSRVDHVRKVLPSRWVETKTTWKYHNGKLASETNHYRYYENGILVHENSTRKTRDELIADGIDVNALDLTTSQLIEYGPALSSTSHSQKHEMHQIKRFKNGQQIYELNHERRFQDGNLVHDKREEKDEDDFESLPYPADAYNTQRQDLSRHSSTGLHSNTGIQAISVNPQTISRKHEVRQEEEFVNGQKVYDFHHEREYHDGKLIRENRTELGPDDLGTHRPEHRDALKELVSGRTHSSVAHNSLIEQQRTADSLLKTSCVTCGSMHGSTTHSQGSILSSLGLPINRGVQAGSTFRQDVNIEEHYQDGALVKGKEEKKKWLDGQLVDAKEEHYYDGPSRANISTGLSSTATLSAFSAAPVGTVHKSSSEDCSFNPCRNKGTCKESLRGPVCVCAFGFKGTYCEEAYCPNRYCRYGGSCSISNEEHICSCHEGYSGYRCSTRHQKVRIGVSG